MKRDFPIIKNIEDVLPAIEGRDEFVIAEREGLRIINYLVAYKDTFAIDEEDLMWNHGRMIPKGLMRRECRGLIFRWKGVLLSRPFHKFFNLDEREETQLRNVNMGEDHVIFEKMDGSMIRPVEIASEKFALATKMGVTDIAKQAEAFVDSWDPLKKANFWHQMTMACMKGITPIFEFVSPNNRIVVNYDSPDLVLLAVRNNETGMYVPNLSDWEKEGFSVAPSHGSLDGDFSRYVSTLREEEGREGVVVAFKDGLRIKIKTDQYVRIHKIKDKISTNRKLLDSILHNEIDDVLPHLDKEDRHRVERFEADFHAKFKEKVAEWTALSRSAIVSAEGDRKRLATEVIPSLDIEKKNHGFIYKSADGHDMNEIMMNFVKNSLGKTVKYDEMAEFFGLEKDGETNENFA